MNERLYSCAWCGEFSHRLRNCKKSRETYTDHINYGRKLLLDLAVSAWIASYFPDSDLYTFGEGGDLSNWRWFVENRLLCNKDVIARQIFATNVGQPFTALNAYRASGYQDPIWMVRATATAKLIQALLRFDGLISVKQDVLHTWDQEITLR